MATFGPRFSSILRTTSGSATRPIGTLSQKIHSQLMPATTAPPTSGPLATARPLRPPRMPSTVLRRSGGNAFETSARPSVITAAAPAP